MAGLLGMILTRLIHTKKTFQQVAAVMGVLVFFGFIGKCLTIYVIKCRLVTKSPGPGQFIVHGPWISDLETLSMIIKNTFRTQRKTWTTNLITLNSIFAISYLLTMAPIDQGKSQEKRYGDTDTQMGVKIPWRYLFMSIFLTFFHMTCPNF